MFDEWLNRAVGLVALAVFVMATTAVLMIGDRPLSAAVHFTVRFSRVGRLRPGAAVRMNNIDLGRVESITYEGPAPSPSKEFGRGDETTAKHGQKGGGVRVVIWVRKSYRRFVRVNSRFLITATSLIGARHVEVLPPDKEPGRAVRAGDELHGEPPPHIDRMLRMAYENLKRSTGLIERLRPDLVAFRAEARRFQELLDDLARDRPHLLGMGDHGRAAYDEWKKDWVILRRSTARGRRLRALANRLEQTSDHLSRRSKHIERRTAEIAARWKRIRRDWHKVQVRVGPFQRRVESAVSRLRNVVGRMERDLKSIASAVDHARGTVGALMGDHEIWDDFKESQKTIKQRIWTLMGRGKKSSPAGYPMP